ncbi:MAG: LytTR family DNA-binding domain-containing protein [Bacteroidota bacterium]|jgi:DNA-binding LytR/AlgR family response regulator|nr:MAG: DNA-binding response regulator [Bacteroidota bacterium]
MNIKCLAVDDEPLAIDLLTSYICKIPELQLVGTHSNPFHALDTLRNTDVDLLFLDINMPEMHGIELYKRIPHPPKVIFITAYDQYAAQGFEVDAIDYLIKPVSFSRFATAINKAIDRIRIQNRKNDFIFVRSEHSIIKVSLDEVYYIEGYKDYVKIHTTSGNPILTITSIKAIETLLPDNFLRIHKSFIIAIDKIIAIRKGKVLIKDKYIPIGDSYREIFARNVLEGRKIEETRSLVTGR